jgi:hypothetical protein
MAPTRHCDERSDAAIQGSWAAMVGSSFQEPAALYGPWIATSPLRGSLPRADGAAPWANNLRYKRRLQRPEFRAFWRFFDIIVANYRKLCHIAFWEYRGRWAAQLDEDDMEIMKLRGRTGDATRARRTGQTGQAKIKTPWGSAQVLDRVRFGQGNPSFSLGLALLDLAQSGWI